MAARLDVIVLCYHGVHPDPRHGEVTPDALRVQLAFVASHGYRLTTFTEAVLGTREGRVAAVTFDDGIASAIKHGEPVLEELGAPGTMFLTIDTLGVSGRLTEADAGALVDRGWEVGSHTVSHPTLTKIDDESLADELVRSKAEVERLAGAACTSVAYPKGRADERVVRAAAAAGYRAGAALEGATPLGFFRARLATSRRPRRRRPGVPAQVLPCRAQRSLRLGTAAGCEDRHGGRQCPAPVKGVSRRRAARRRGGRSHVRARARKRSTIDRSGPT